MCNDPSGNGGGRGRRGGIPTEAIIKAVVQGGSRWGGRHPSLCTVWAKKERENAGSWLPPKILQRSQRSNVWELPGQAASPCLSFPRCKMWMKTLEGNFLALGWAWGFADRVMGGDAEGVFLHSAVKSSCKYLSSRRNPSPETPLQSGGHARKALHLSSHLDIAAGMSCRAGVAPGLSL